MTKAAQIGGKQLYTGRIVKTGENALPDPSGIYNQKLEAGTNPSTIIRANGDDGYGDFPAGHNPSFNCTELYVSESFLRVGRGNRAFLTFSNVVIPQGSTITKAELTINCVARGANYTDGYMYIYGHDVDDSVAPTSAAEFTDMFDTPPYTSAHGFVDFSGINLGSNTLDGYFDFSPFFIFSNISVIEEIVGRGGWTSGNKLSLLLFGLSNLSNPNIYIDISSYDSGGDYPTLDVEYS